MLEEGPVAPGDPVSLLHRVDGSVTLAELIAALYHPGTPDELLERVLASPAIKAEHQARIETLRRTRA